MSDASAAGLLDRIYEAGAAPQLWADVLNEINRLAGGLGAAFFVPRTGQWLATTGIEEMMADLMTSGLINTNERTRRLLALEPVGFYRDIDIFNLEDLPKEPVYRDFFIPRGGGFGTATVIDAPSGDRMILHVERSFSRGLVERTAIRQLDSLRPHLARASLLSARLEMREAAAATETLEMLGLPGGILDRCGRLIAANRLLEKLVPAAVLDRRSRATLADKRADGLLEAAIEDLTCNGGKAEAVRSIPVPAGDSSPPLIIHIVPVRGLASDIFTSASAILVITPVVPRDVPNAEILQGLFDLTPAEARIARLVGNGDTVGDAARAVGIADETARKQLKAVLAKTGVHRQADLVGLLSGASLPVRELP